MLKAIKNLDVSEEFRLLNFKESYYKAKNGRIQSAENSADYSTDINTMFIQSVYKDSKGRKQKRK